MGSPEMISDNSLSYRLDFRITEKLIRVGIIQTFGTLPVTN